MARIWIDFVGIPRGLKSTVRGITGTLAACDKILTKQLFKKIKRKFTHYQPICIIQTAANDAIF